MAAQSLEALMRSRGIEPREVTFSAPWEARAFALALALAEQHRFDWEEFRGRLISEIAQADKTLATGGNAPSYFECWLTALEATITAKEIADASEIDQTADRIAANPPAPTAAIATGPIKIA
jgi:nitrile hydratase accessory protein